MLLTFTLSACQLNPANKNNKNKTALPLSKEAPILIEQNQGYTGNAHYLSGETDYIFYNLNPAKDNQLAEVRFVKVLNRDPLELSTSQLLNNDLEKTGRHISSIVQIEGVNWIYYVEGNSLKDQARSFRAQWVDEQLRHIEPLNMNKRLVVRSWQRFHYHDGVVYMVHTGSGLFFAKSTDGLNFDGFEKLTGFSAQPRVSILGDKPITAFQKGTLSKGLMNSFFTVTNNSDTSWQDPVLITEQHENVHDTFLFARPDGNIDAYYVHPIGNWRGFSLFRRCINQDLTLGQPELLVEKEIGSLVAPNVFETPQGVMVLFVEQLSGYNPYILPVKGYANCQSPS